MKKTRQKKPAEVMSLSQLKKYIRTSFDNVKMLVETGAIKGRRIGNRWHVHKSEADRWLTCKEE